MNASQLINQTSGLVSFGTPPEILEAARECMGGIDLDPASSEAFNRKVKANNYYTEQDDALSLRWKACSVWLNHPFHKGELACPIDRNLCKKKGCVTRGYHIDKNIPSNFDWMSYFVSEYVIHDSFYEACNITFANTSEKWFHLLTPYPQCIILERTNYYLEDGTLLGQVPKGSVVTYLGPNIDRFARAFEKLGTIKVRYTVSL